MNLQLLMDIHNEDAPHKEVEVTVGRYEGKINFKIRTLTGSEVYEIQREAINEETGRTDNEKYNIALLEHCMVTYNPKDVELRNAYGVYSSQEVIDAMFNPSELIKLLRICDSFAMRGVLPDEVEKPKVDLKK